MTQPYATIFSAPARWAVRLVAWIAFAVAAYLAWNALHGTSVAGCGGGDETGCDIVLSSSWARWLDVPVSYFGLACYASLAALSVMLGLTGSRVGRWIDTFVVMLSLVALGASAWFVGVQLVAIKHICRYCMVVDLCGIVLGGIAIWSVVRSVASSGRARAADKGLMALRSVTAPRAAGVPLVTKPAAPLRSAAPHARPSIALAFGGAIALLTILIGGQIMMPSKTFALQKVALDQPIDLTHSTAANSADPAHESATANEHVAMRIPTESTIDSDAAKSDSATTSELTQGDAPSDLSSADESEQPAEDSSATTSEPPADEAPPKKSRLVKFLNGSLTLDVYEHPVLGNPEAPHVMVELVSYDCPHCRKMHSTMQKGLRRYGQQLAIIVLVVPLESKCNRLVTDPRGSHPGACTTARMALTVASLNPRAFPSFHDWLMKDEEKPPSQSSIVAKAFGLVDREKCRKLSQGDELDNKISQYVDLFGNLRDRSQTSKSFGLPVQILGDEVMGGSAEDPEDVYKAWEKNLGIESR